VDAVPGLLHVPPELPVGCHAVTVGEPGVVIFSVNQKACWKTRNDVLVGCPHELQVGSGVEAAQLVGVGDPLDGQHHGRIAQR
jgi:hypothetical protein